MGDPLFELYRLDEELSREQVIAELAASPARVRDIVAGRAAAELERRASDGWSPIEVCRHLRDAIQVYGMRFKWMILDRDPFLPNYDEDRWVAESPDRADDIEAVLREMDAYRAETVRLLAGLADDGWSRRGRHELSGEVVLEPYVRHELAHERQHLSQLRRAFGEA